MSENWRERRALVTGATGIVGSWLCEALIERGATVVAMVLDDDPQSRFYREGIDGGCHIVRGNLAHIEDCARAINVHEADVVFHLGAQTIVGTAEQRIAATVKDQGVAVPARQRRREAIRGAEAVQRHAADQQLHR